MRKTLILCAAAFAAMTVCAETVVIEAESFADLGGWVIDSQHMETMGSPYLLAHGLGQPVADAKTTFTVSEAGEYDVYVKTRNWTAYWSEEAAGRFKLAVNGFELADTFGIGSADWRWVKASAKTRLNAGVNSVVIKDLTGFDGRVDAVCFTTDSQPPQISDPPSPSQTVSVDLVVCGGGVAGICTALSAARSGVKVALVQDRPVLGGNNSSEVRVWLGGHIGVGKYPRLGDVVAEIGPKGGGNARSARFFEDDKKLAVVRAEKNIELHLNTKVVEVEKKEDRIAAVIGQDVRTGKRIRFKAPLFVDATGDATIGFLAGADFRMGRESKAETGERNAPEKADSLTMGASCQWRAVESGTDNVFRDEKWMVKLNEKTATAKLRGDWDWETGLGRDQVAEAERIRDYGMLMAYSNWAFVKNHSSRKKDFRTKRLKWVAYVAGKRENRRLLGDVILSEEDIIEAKAYPDGTCLCSWSIDLHYPKTEQETGFKGESFRSRCEQSKIVMYPIPYRCFYSRNIPNLFMAGRDISVTHNALGTVRVMRTTGMMGEVVGMAAAICKAHGCEPRDVYNSFFGELEARMTKGVGAGLAKTRQVYNLHPTYGLDPKNAAEMEYHGKLNWAETSALWDEQPSVEWSYPPRVWPRWEYARAKGEKSDDLDKIVKKGVVEGWDVFLGTETTPPHRMSYPEKDLTPSEVGGAFYVGGMTFGHIHCLAKECPELRFGDTLATEESCRMVVAGSPDEWRSEQALAFAYFRLTGGEIRDAWVITDEARPLPKRFFKSGEWGADVQRFYAAETLRLCTRRFFVRSIKDDPVPHAEDLPLAFFADAALYGNAEVARFSLDALDDASPWWVISNWIYRRLYDDIGYIKARWGIIRERVESMSGGPAWISRAAYFSAALLADELGAKKDASKWRAKARKIGLTGDGDISSVVPVFLMPMLYEVENSNSSVTKSP